MGELALVFIYICIGVTLTGIAMQYIARGVQIRKSERILSDIIDKKTKSNGIDHHDQENGL